MNEIRVGICSIVRNESPYIEEWLAFHILQGAKSFVFYDNSSDDDTVTKIRRFKEAVDIEIVSWPTQDKIFDVLQRLAYTDGAARLKSKVDFVAFIDCDEFLYSADRLSLGSALSKFEPDVGAVAVCQKAFGSSEQKRYRPKLVTERFTRCANLNNSESHWFKTIARPSLIQSFDSVHSVKLIQGKYVLCDGKAFNRPFPHPGFSNRSCQGIVSLNHYILKSQEEFEWKKMRWKNNDTFKRYVEEYFLERDQYCNECVSTDLVSLKPIIRALIDNPSIQIGRPDAHPKIGIRSAFSKITALVKR